MTLVAMCVHDCPNVQIITFELMSNHVHFILCGTEETILAFFTLFKKRLRRYLAVTGHVVSLDHFDCKKPVAIDNLESLRNQICYTNRNNYVIDPEQTPFSYPYGANSLYFSPIAKERKHGCYGDLNMLEKRKFVHSKATDYPKSLTLIDGYFSPMNYCRFDIGEGVFRDARHYFNKLAKEVESYRDIAALIGDTIFYTDDELNDVLRRLCRDKYNSQRASLLGRNEKMELARTLHYDYNADNAKIARLLKMPVHLLDELYPLRKKG